MAPLGVRAPTDEDIPGLVDLLNANDLDELGAPESDEEDVAWRWRVPGFDRDNDCVIAELGGDIVAYALAFEGEAVVVVHPVHRGLGIGSALAKACEEHVAAKGESPDGYVRQTVTEGSRAVPLLESRGYERSHHYARMEIELQEEPSTPELPSDIIVRRFVPGQDERAAFEANMAAWAQYSDRWQPETFERWSANYLDGEDFVPSLWSVADRAGSIVGISICFPYLSMGWVQTLGVIPNARGLGIGRALLQRSFHIFWTRGITRIGLTANSQNLPEVQRLYQSAGMQEVSRYVNYRLLLARIT